MRRFLFWAGGLVLVLVLLSSFASGLFPRHVACEQYYGSYANPVSAPEQTSTAVAPDWFILAECQGVQNDLYLAYYFIAVGAALVGIGFVTGR
ncbi:hypothetical protein JXA12_02910 [Candidatus Woesearchaeota archaeon]|nr:hypothetical protein [Candidatus Woesearchaeota archaeon]